MKNEGYRAPRDPRANRRFATLLRGRTLLVGCSILVGCAGDEVGEADRASEADRVSEADHASVLASATGSAAYCQLPAVSSDVLIRRPSADEPAIDDVNWFARPVPHEGMDRIIAFASHNQNYIYNLTTGARVPIPDRSDAVATPDGRYMTVPSSYTPDSTVRFYPVAPMLDRLERGEDADDLEPSFIHRHANMRRVYYQSTGLVSEEATTEGVVATYRLMFSGGADESGFRIVDYRFTHDAASGALIGVAPSAPMALCPIVTNDLNTPFISKNGKYVAAYTSDQPARGYTAGASLKVFQIVSTDPAAGTTSCEPVLDFGFAAGKADFSFDGSMLTFHTSQGGYLTPFVNGGLEPGTITDVVVARLTTDSRGAIRSAADFQRVTTSVKAGVGSYFPAFFPDGSLFYIANSVPKDSDQPKRFQFLVVDPQSTPWRKGVFDTLEKQEQWQTVATLWERTCARDDPALAQPPFPLQPHESPWLGLSLNPAQCRALIADARGVPDANTKAWSDSEWESLTRLCGSLAS